MIAQTTESSGAVSTALAAKTITIAAPNVALRASFVATPRTATAGQALGLSLQLTNTGNVTANGALPLTFNVIDASGAIVQTLSFKRSVHVAAGKSSIVRLSVKLVKSLPSQIAVNASLTPSGAIAFATSSTLTFSTSSISVITRSASALIGSPAALTAFHAG